MFFLFSIQFISSNLHLVVFGSAVSVFRTSAGISIEFPNMLGEAITTSCFLLY